MKKSCRKTGNALVRVCFILPLLAWGDVVVDVGETLTLSNETEAAQSEAIRLADRTQVKKTGNGKLVIPSGAFAENQSVELRVHDGRIAITNSAQFISSYDEPTDVFKDAAFHLAADKNVKFKDGSATEVESWLDVRETGLGTSDAPYDWPRAVAFTNKYLTAFPLKQSHKGKTGVYCRGYGSGCFMNWVNADGSQANIKGIKHVFIVHGGPSSKGDVLGQRYGGTPYFQRGSGDTLWIQINNETRPMHSARTYLNGHEIDAFAFTSTYPTNANHVVEVQALADTLGAMCFFNDRDMQQKTTDGTNLKDANSNPVSAITGNTDNRGGGNRAGGEYIFELVIFKRALTAAERIAVSDYLNFKWRNVTPPASIPETTVGLSSNATFEVTADTTTTLTITGDGVLEKVGSSSATIRSTFTPHNDARHVRVAEGLLTMGSALPLVTRAGDIITCERRYWGNEIQPNQTGSDTTTITKNGSGSILIDSIPQGVSNIVVNGGELKLADPERRRRIAEPSKGTVAATIPEWNFESYQATSLSTAYRKSGNGDTTIYGWHCIVPDTGNPESNVMFYDQRYGSPTGWNMNLQKEPTTVFVIKNDASAWCEITVPEDGDYELRFKAAARSAYFGEQLDVMIGKDETSLESFGDFWITSANQDWRDYVFPIKCLKAGTYQFWFKTKGKSTDCCTMFDDITLTCVNGDGPIWNLPNGGFEIHSPNFTDTTTPANNTLVPGFEIIESTNPDTRLDPVNIVSTNSLFSVKGYDNNAIFNLPWNRPDSLTQIFLSGSGAKVITTFTPPKGKWRFRSDFATTKIHSKNTTAYILDATVSIGGAVQSLGAVTNNSSWALIPRTWPVAFDSDGETPVALTLTGEIPTSGTKVGHALLDNFALVRDSSLQENDNLIRNGSFDFEEAYSYWTVTATPKPKGVTCSSVLDPSFYALHFGSDKIDGEQCLRIVNDDTISQIIDVPKAGLYRFSFNAEARSTPGSLNFSSARNPLYAFIAKDGVTNILGQTDEVVMTNFNEYAFIARIPSAGTYTAGIRGTCVWGGLDSAKVDKTTVVDAIQLYPIETEGEIELGENLSITVAKGAQLALDFDGVKKIASLKIGNKRYSGNVSLATHPELLGVLSGRGELFIEKRGFYLILK